MESRIISLEATHAEDQQVITDRTNTIDKLETEIIGYLDQIKKLEADLASATFRAEKAEGTVEAIRKFFPEPEPKPVEVVQAEPVEGPSEVVASVETVPANEYWNAELEPVPEPKRFSGYSWWSKPDHISWETFVAEGGEAEPNRYGSASGF